jgi:alpha-tubulin suppressor-like RCC1 family protein
LSDLSTSCQFFGISWTIYCIKKLEDIMETTKAERSESFGVSVPIPIVYSWGRSDLGNLFRKPDEEAADGVYQFQSTRTIIAVSTNVYHSAAVTSTGELYTCGENYDGQVAPKSAADASEATDWTRPRILELLGGQQRITSVSCGLTHTVCVTSSGRAISFGGNESGQLGHTSNAISNVPPKIVAFHTHSAAGGSAGSGGQGGLLIKKAACGDLFSLFLTTSGEVYGCGSAAYLGNLLTGKSGEEIVRVAQRIEAFTSTHVVEVVACSGHALVLTGTGEVYAWGDNAQYQLGYASRPAESTTTTDAGTNLAA